MGAGPDAAGAPGEGTDHPTDALFLPPRVCPPLVLCIFTTPQPNSLSYVHIAPRFPPSHPTTHHSWITGSASPIAQGGADGQVEDQGTASPQSPGRAQSEREIELNPLTFNYADMSISLPRISWKRHSNLYFWAQNYLIIIISPPDTTFLQLCIGRAIKGFRLLCG